MSGNLFVISGPSGVGKDSLMALIFEFNPDLIKWVTCTTRKPRKGEVEGKNYFFKTIDEFKLLIENNELVEWNVFADNYYGTPKSFARKSLEDNMSIITVIDVNGAKNVKKSFPEANLIFIEPPSLEALKSRLLKRGTEQADTIEKRLAIVDSELAQREFFDKVFINDNLRETADKVSDYIKTVQNNNK